MLVPAEKEVGRESAGEGKTRGWEYNGRSGDEKKRRGGEKTARGWIGKREEVRRRIEPILAQGTRVKYRRTGKLLPDVKFRPGANFAACTWKNTLRRD